MKLAIASTVFCVWRHVLAIACGAVVSVCATAESLAKDVSHELGRIKTPELAETSGLAASRLNPDVLWLNNDGGSGRLVAVSTTGKLVALVTCRAKLDDVEEIAIGPGPTEAADYLYLGDIGDNSQRRREIRIVRFPEPDLNGERGQLLDVDKAEEFRLVYPDGPHDAEAMLIDSVERELFIVTKEKNKARLYSIPLNKLRAGANEKLVKSATLEVEDISAASVSRDGRRILMRREKDGWLWPREKGERLVDALAREPEKVPVLGKKQAANGEAIGFSASGKSYFTVSEGKKQSIYEFALE
jgi:hypothetical protein